MNCFKILSIEPRAAIFYTLLLVFDIKVFFISNSETKLNSSGDPGGLGKSAGFCFS